MTWCATRAVYLCGGQTHVSSISTKIHTDIFSYRRYAERRCRVATWNLPDYQAEAADRMIMCKKIADLAVMNGLLADANKVNRQYRVWLRWYRGQLCTGYLIKMTGVKRASVT